MHDTKMKDDICRDYSVVLDTFNMNIESFISFCNNCLNNYFEQEQQEPDLLNSFSNNNINNLIFQLLQDKNNETRLIQPKSIFVSIKK